VSVLASPQALRHVRSVGLDPERLPRHIAIIMDGNGRWAQQRGQPRVMGHAQGVQTVRQVVEECSKLGIGYLTLYCLSSENWKRPQAELDFLMALLEQYLIEERAEILAQNIRFSTIGRRTDLPERVLQEIDENIRLSRQNTGLSLCLAINYGGRTELLDAFRHIGEQVRAGLLDPEQIDENIRLSRQNTGLSLCLAINYGGRTELLDAFRHIGEQVRAGLLDPEQIDETAIANALYTGGMPDPDLLIRTAGEMRVSNFLLWQISYAELWVTPKCWPDFDRDTLHAALHDYARRERRFGGLK